MQNRHCLSLLILSSGRLPASRLQSQIAAHVATLAEAVRIFQGQHKRQRDQRAHALHLLQQRHLRITLLRQVLDAIVVFHDALAQRFDCVQQRFQCRLQFRAQAFGFLRIPVAYVAPAQALPVTLCESACRVDQRRSCPYQSCPRPNRHGCCSNTSPGWIAGWNQLLAGCSRDHRFSSGPRRCDSRGRRLRR